MLPRGWSYRPQAHLIQKLWFRRYRARAPPANAVFRALLQKSATSEFAAAGFSILRALTLKKSTNLVSVRVLTRAIDLVRKYQRRSAAARSMPVCIKSRRNDDRRPRLCEGVDHFGRLPLTGCQNSAYSDDGATHHRLRCLASNPDLELIAIEAQHEQPNCRRQISVLPLGIDSGEQG